MFFKRLNNTFLVIFPFTELIAEKLNYSISTIRFLGARQRSFFVDWLIIYLNARNSIQKKK